MLHLFSGFRRKVDVEWWIRALAESTNLIVDVCSVDVAVDRSMDVTQDKVRLALLEDVRRGFCHASIKGPPCTTWSRARFNQKKGGPRPLRTRSEPRGRSDIVMTESERKKLNLGTQLLNVSLDVCEEIAKVDGVFILEHLRDPGAPPYSSIFDLPRVRTLASQREVDSIDPEQCQFGMPARKATAILTRGVSDEVREEAQAILGRRCNHARHELTLEGTNPDGTFKTSAAQVYPSELCRAMVLVLIKNFVVMENTGARPDPEGEVTTPAGLTFTPPAPGRTREERRAGARVRAPALSSQWRPIQRWRLLYMGAWSTRTSTRPGPQLASYDIWGGRHDQEGGGSWCSSTRWWPWGRSPRAAQAHHRCSACADNKQRSALRSA